MPPSLHFPLHLYRDVWTCSFIFRVCLRDGKEKSRLFDHARAAISEDSAALSFLDASDSSEPGTGAPCSGRPGTCKYSGWLWGPGSTLPTAENPEGPAQARHLSSLPLSALWTYQEMKRIGTAKADIVKCFKNRHGFEFQIAHFLSSYYE